MDETAMPLRTLMEVIAHADIPRRRRSPASRSRP